VAGIGTTLPFNIPNESNFICRGLPLFLFLKRLPTHQNLYNYRNWSSFIK
jgi:hypothetical protein